MNREISTLAQLSESYDWRHIFREYGKPEPVLGSKASTEPFDIDDVNRIIGLVDGERDGPDWVGVFRLKDDRYVSLSAGCDYTGWGCQEGGQANCASTLQAIIRYGLTDDERNRLGVTHPQ